MKHIDITYHLIIHEVSNKKIELVKIDHKFNLANTLIKVILIENFSIHCATMQVLHEELK